MPGKSFLPCSIALKIPARCYAYALFLLLVSAFAALPSGAQTPSVIYGKALNGGDKVLDPNLDGYVSLTTAGFTGGDIGAAYSEIPYRFFPQMGTEPLADLVTGANGGHTDLAERPLGMFFDGAHVLVRVRLGGNSTASKGYSMLIDANNSYNTGTNGLPFLTPSKVINPGFEYEIAFASNFDVKLYRHQGSGDTNDPYTTNVIWTGNLNTFSQRSVAYTTAGGDPDYFYDFYVPLSAFQGGITSSTPLRLTGSTVTSAQTGLTGTISDVGGVDDRLFGNDARKIWAQVINTFPATSLDQLKDGEFGCLKSLAPVLNAPVKQFDTTVQGTSAEADGSIIKVYKGGTVTNNVLSGATLLGTGTVSGGSWSVAVTTVALNDQVRATAVSQSPLKCESLVSNTVTVTAGDCKVTPPVITSAINGNKGVNGTTSIAEAHRIYVYLLNADGSTSTGPFSTSNFVDLAANSTSWSIQAAQQGQSFTDGTYVAVAAPHGSATPTISCTSKYSGYFCFAKSGSLATTAQPAVTEAYLLTSSTSLSGTAPANATLSVYRNDIRTSASATANASGAWTAAIGGLGLQAGDLVTVVASITGGCPSAPSTARTVYSGVTATPAIAGTYCLPASGSTSLTLTGTSAEPGALIRLYAGATELSTSPTPVRVSDQGLWYATLSGITSATVLTARATGAGKVESAASAAASFNTQSSNGTLSFTKSNFTTPINGGSTSPTVIDGTTTNYITNGTGADGGVYGTYSFPASTTNTSATIRVYLDKSLLDSVVLAANPAVTSGYAWSLTDLSQQELYAGALVTATVTLRATGPGGLSQCESPFRAPSGINPYDLGAPIAAYDYVQCRTVPASPGTFNFTATAICQYTPLTVTVSNSLSTLYYKVYVNGQARSAYVAGNNGALSITTQALATAGTRTITVRAATDPFTGGCQAALTVTGVSPEATAKTLTVNASTLTIPTVTGTVSCYNTAATLTITNSNLQAAGSGTYQLKKDGVNISGATVAANATAGLTLTVPATATTTSGIFTVAFLPATQTGSNCPVESAPITATIPLLSRTPTTGTPSICANNTATLAIPTEYGGANVYTYRVYLNTTANLVATLTGDGTTQTVVTPAFTGTAPYTTNAVHSFFVEVTRQGCAAARVSGSATVTVGTAATAPTTANAGADQTVCPPSFSLAGNQPASGTGRWTIVSQPAGGNALFSDATRYNATVSNLVSGVYTFRWTITASCSAASSADEVTITANCPTRYAVSSPDYVNNYKLNEVLASPYDSEGFAASGTSFTLLSGSLPPGTSLDPVTGQVRLTDLNAFAAMTSYSYSFTTSARDKNSTLTNVPVSMSFYPAASQRSLMALPVTLVYFRGETRDGSVRLQWATATEKNNRYFVVEKSSDGTRFLPLAQVAGAGQSTAFTRYEYLDCQPGTGTVYYRLRQVDFDEAHAYSKTIAVHPAGREEAVSLQAYPNPTRGLLHLAISRGQEWVAVEVRDTSGKVWLKQDFAPGAALQLRLQSLPAGIYLVRASAGGRHQQLRVVKE